MGGGASPARRLVHAMLLSDVRTVLRAPMLTILGTVATIRPADITAADFTLHLAPPTRKRPLAAGSCRG